MNELVECPFCKTINEGSRQYCQKCGRLIQLSVRDSLPKLISVEQIIWILLGGYSIYFLLRFFIQLEFSVLILISAITSFIMFYRLKYLSGDTELNEFFPMWKQFLFIAGFIIWFIEIVSLLTLTITYRILIQDIIIKEIVPFSWEFIQGYILGITVPLFYYYYKKRNISVKLNS